MRSLSIKRQKAVKSGKVRLVHGSTIQQMSAEEYRKQQTERAKEFRQALYGGSKKKRSPRLIAKDRAWDQFSMFIRTRDADDNGIAKCCTCGTYKHWRKMDAGHYVTRAKEATLFDEIGTAAQCKGCNRYQGGKPVEFERFLESKYGEGTAQRIRHKSVMECRRDLHDYLAIEKHYKRLVDDSVFRDTGKWNDRVKRDIEASGNDRVQLEG